MKARKSIWLLCIICLVSILAILLLPSCGKTPSTTPTSTKPAPAPAAEVFKWRCTTPAPEGQQWHYEIKPFADWVKQASGGRLVIDMFGGGSLYPIFDSLPSVKQGLTEASAVWSVYWAGQNDLLMLCNNRPCDPLQTYEQNWDLWEKAEKVTRDAYGSLGVYFVSEVFVAPPGDIIHSKKPLRSINDFKGLKLRSSGLCANMFGSAGASVVTLPADEVYTALQTGTIDAAETQGWVGNWDMGLQEVTKYVIKPTLTVGVAKMELIVTPSIWAALPADLQSIVSLSARLNGARTYCVGAAMYPDYEAKFKGAGNEILTLPAADVVAFQKIAMGLVAGYKAKPAAAEYVKIYHDVLVKWGFPDQAKILE